jgi:hypothetical protein
MVHSKIKYERETPRYVRERERIERERDVTFPGQTPVIVIIAY